MLELLHWPALFISFCIGMALVYVFQKTPNVTIVWPNPERAPKTLYENGDGTCYAYSANKVTCKE